MKPKTLVVIDRPGVISVLTSKEMYDDLVDVANGIISDRRYKAKTKRRYTIEKAEGRKRRAGVNIVDKNPDALQNEVETGTLQRLSRRKIQ